MAQSPTRTVDEVASPRLYIERVVFSATADAEAAFDFLVELTAEKRQETVRYRFGTGAGDLVLHGPVRRPAPRPTSAVYPVRLVPGNIVSRTGMYRIRVELELLRWSGRASAVGLRPRVHRHHPLGFGPYLRIGGEAMTVLRKEIEAWVKAGAGVASR